MIDPSPNRYHYTARVQRVVDGDTIVADIDLGLSIWCKGELLRLHGINTPEIVGADKAAGLAAKQALVELLGGVPGNWPVVVETFKDGDDKYGRLLARVMVKRLDGLWICVNDELQAAGHAKAWNGQGVKP